MVVGSLEEGHMVEQVLFVLDILVVVAADRVLLDLFHPVFASMPQAPLHQMRLVEAHMIEEHTVAVAVA